jgi:YbbR-like protein
VSLRFLTHNFGWKVGSLMLAVLLWFAIVGEPEVATTRAVPILYKNLHKDLLLGSDVLDSVRLELRGPASRLTTAALADLAVQLDLGNVADPGERTFTLSDADLHLPEGVAFLRAIPSQLRLRFARRAARDVPVEVRIFKEPPEGYAVIAHDAVPPMLRIAGPEGRVTNISSAATDGIDLSGITQSGDFRVNVFVADPQVWLESNPMVTVHVTIEKRGTNN